MKKIFGIVLAVAMMASCTDKTKFTISGESEKFAGKYAYLQVEKDRQLTTVDSVAVAGNAFKLEGTAEQPYTAYVVIKEAGAERPELFTQLYVEPAEMTINVIEGENESGKSTLLRCINQMEKPTTGRVWVDGVEILTGGVVELRYFCLAGQNDH